MAGTDVTVVGAGVIGLSIAWRLGAAGRSVTLIDPNPGRGASYVAAGMLAPVTEATYGEEPLLELNLDSARRWPAFAAALEADSGLGVGLRALGTLLVGRDAGDRSELEELMAFQHQLGLRASWFSPSAARELEPLLAPDISGALFAEDDHQVDNRRVLGALAVAVGAQGARFVRAPLDALETTAGAVTAAVADGEVITAETVVLAAGHASGSLPDLPEELAGSIRPVKGQILRLFAPEPELRLTRTVRVRVAGHSAYVVPRSEGRVVIGATVEEKGCDETATAGAVYELLRDASRVLPVVHEYELRELGVGLRPASADNAPVIGATSVPGLVVATGHYRNGILLAPVTAEAVVALLDTGTLPAYAEPFAPSDHRSPAAARR